MIKVITGSMFSGKSFELIKELKRLNKEQIIIFKPKIDKRDGSLIKSRKSNKTYNGILIDNVEEIPSYLNKNIKTIIIDEAQFLTGDINVVMNLHLQGYDFIIAGLSLTSERKPFGLMRDFLSIATEIKILKAKCYCCGKKEAEYTGLFGNSKKEDILIKGDYFPICRKCLGEMKYGKL